jgi:hypothetical protein
MQIGAEHVTGVTCQNQALQVSEALCKENPNLKLSLSADARAVLQTQGSAFVGIVGDRFSQHNATIPEE